MTAMLKSTHPLAQRPEELPPGWTQHTAPTGHTYYYNAETKQSTYKRPVEQAESQPPPPYPHTLGETAQEAAVNDPFANGAFDQFGPSHFQTQYASRLPPNQRFQRHDRREKEDRPKTKHPVPGCAPWLLIKTRLGRRFVHNPESGESFWKFPKEVIGGVVEYDIQERERRERRERGEATPPPTEEDEQRRPASETQAAAAPENEDYDIEEIEEVDYTDDEEDDEGNPSKRARTDENADDDEQIEFGEEDMAYQLAQMGQDYDLDPGEYEDEEAEWEEGAEGLPLTDEEITAGFKSLLDDYRINPYKPWDSVIEEGSIIEDDRYTLLPNMKSRKDVFAEWSAERIAQLKEARAKQAKLDPRIPYLALLEKHATPKLYWPEFKRKFKKEPEMKDANLSDKDREKLYRDYINRITKLSQSALSTDLKALMKSIPASATWNRSTAVDGTLPSELLKDVRYISLKPGVRDPLLQDFIETLPRADDVVPDDAEASAQKRADQDKLQRALAERQKQVEEAKRRQQRELQHGKGKLRDEERELQRAMNVGKDGLRGNIRIAEGHEMD